MGYLKASPDGKKLGNAIFPLGYYLYDFDNTTGVISNPVQLGLPSNWAYGLSFSPDNNLLYGLGISDGRIYQWDLQAGSAAAIIASATVVGTATGGTPVGFPAYKGGAIQAGPDGKLYVVQYYEPFLSVINNPNTVGTGCNFQTNAVSLQGRTGVLGLPNFITDYPKAISHTGHCLGAPTSFMITGSASFLDSAKWDFGDPVSGTLNTSEIVSPAHQYTDTGSFTVRLVRYLACISDTSYTTVHIDATPVVDLGPDTSTCGDTVMLGSSVTYTNLSWLWSDGTTGPDLSVTQTGTYWLQVTENGCAGTDTIVVDISATLSVDLGPDLSLCDRDTPVVLRSPQAAGTHYLWSNGLSDTQMTVTRSGDYWLQIDRNGCKGGDTVRISVIPTPSVYIGPDSTICEQSPLRIGADIPGALYRWNTGETTAHISVSSSGPYLLEVNLDGCFVYDTIQITAMPTPDIDLGADGDICPEQTITLDGAYSMGSSYRWSTGDTTASVSVTSAGSYSIQVTSEYKCIGGDSITLRYYPKPSVLLPEDTTVCEETPLWGLLSRM